jgi:Holliday junction resolvase RusA-like endonuclease
MDARAVTINARKALALTIEGRPQRWMRTTEYFNEAKGRMVRINEKKPRAHKEMVARLAALKFKGPPITCPIILEMRFIFAIPKSWPPAVRQAAIEGRLPHTVDPDADQLIKQIQDSLTGLIYVDDNQVWRYHNTFKRYGAPERTEIIVWACDTDPGALTPSQARLQKRQAQKLLL